jgi:hypothetical protein
MNRCEQCGCRYNENESTAPWKPECFCSYECEKSASQEEGKKDD